MKLNNKPQLEKDYYKICDGIITYIYIYIYK